MRALAANEQARNYCPLEHFQLEDYKKMREERVAREGKKREHCGMKGHLKEECFQIHGFPEWFKHPKGWNNVRHVANTETKEDNHY